VNQLQANLNVVPTLGLSQKPWTVCAWHKNQRLYQVGTKKDETGYGVYDACKDAGALIMTGHEHSFSRTHSIDVIESQQVAQYCVNLSCVYNLTNATIVSVSGLGGYSQRTPLQSLSSLPYWAATHSTTNGALFCKFNFNGVMTFEKKNIIQGIMKFKGDSEN